MPPETGVNAANVRPLSAPVRSLEARASKAQKLWKGVSPNRAGHDLPGEGSLHFVSLGCRQRLEMHAGVDVASTCRWRRTMGA